MSHVQCHNLFGVLLATLKVYLGLGEAICSIQKCCWSFCSSPWIFGTKKLRTIGTDLGAAVKGFKQAMSDGESEEKMKQIKQDGDADFEANSASREAEIKTPPKTNS